MKTPIAISVFAISLGFVSAAQAVPISFVATDNATVQNAGPRSGANGKNFFNLEGSGNGANGSFASFGVLDFNFASLPALGGAVTGLSNVTLQLTQSNAAFSHDGNVGVYFTSQTGRDIQPGTSLLKDQNATAFPVDGTASVDPLLSPLTFLGTGLYVNAGTANHPTDSYSLNFTDGALTSFINALNGGSTLRLVVTADDPVTAATYAGFSNTAINPPRLVFDAAVVPEPASALLLGIGLIGVVAGSRRLPQRTNRAWKDQGAFHEGWAANSCVMVYVRRVAEAGCCPPGISRSDLSLRV